MTDLKKPNGEKSSEQGKIKETSAAYLVIGDDQNIVESGEETKTETSIVSCKIRLCAYCGEQFSVKRPWMKFCQVKCRQLAWEKAHPRIGLVKR